MSKRVRITAIVATLCVCLSLFVVGVLSATSAKFNVTSTLNFTADGVYVMVDASLKQGADVGTAAVLAEGAPTQPTFKAYSYPRESGQDYPNGEPSTKHFVNESGTQVNTWAIGDINYTSTNKVVVYEFTVSNYSPFEVQGTVSGISEALATYVEQGQLTITTYTGTSSSSATATDTPTYTFNIPARTNETTPGTACYKIAVTLNNFMNNLATGEIVMNVSFGEKPPSARDYLTWVADPDTETPNDGYWTLTMGEYEDPITHEITPLVWRMVLMEEGNDVSSVANYTQDTTLSGSYYFLLDTYIANVFNCSFENNFTYSYPYPRLDEYGNTVKVNDYAVSNIREYLTGTDVYRGNTSSGYGSDIIPALATGQDKEENFLDVFNITSSPIYSMIEGRTLSDLYSRMAYGTSGREVIFDTDVENGVGELAGIDPDTTKDKLWLLSHYEAYKITGSEEEDSGARSWDADYRLRSPYLNSTHFVCFANASGLIGNSNNAYNTFCVRPAFKISIN